jgi:protein tyrosine phosphatase
VDGYNQTNMFILTEGPEDVTAQRFWDIIWDHNCDSIVMLTPLDAEEVRGGVAWSLLRAMALCCVAHLFISRHGV